MCTVLAQPLGWAAPEGETPTAGGEARSPGSIDPAEAFAWGRKLWEAGDHAAALPLFQRALVVTGSPNARLYVARCLRELDRLPEAHEEMARTLREAMAQAEKEERYVPTRDTAATELALLERRIGRLVVALDSSLAGAHVVVNGVTLPADRLGQTVAVAPGAVRIVATATDGGPVTRDVDVPAGAMLTVTLSAAAAPKVTPQVPTQEPNEGQDDGEGFGTLRFVGIAVGAVGVAGFVTFAIGRVQANAEIATLEADCGQGPCTDATYGDVIDRGKTAETMAGIGLGVGIAGVLAGTALILFGGPSGNDAEAAWSPTANGLRLRF